MFAVGFEDAPTIAGWRVVHERGAVEFDTTYVLVSDPYVYMRRLEVVLSCVHNEPELSCCGDCWHPMLLNAASTPTGELVQKCIINDTSVKGRVVA
jgi:hypothetical protein